MAKKEKEKFCGFCMEPIDASGTVCPFCKRKQGDYKNLPHQLKPDTILSGKYIIGSVIGEGGFGITYMGRDLTLDMQVAVKEYYPAGNVNRNTESSSEISLTYSKTETEFNEGKKKFLSEARVLARLVDAPGIVNVRDFFNENNTAYIVMEYLKGITLEKYLQSVGKIPVEKVLTLMYPVMDALEQVHQKGLIHRDISPSNIMLTGEWNVKLLDFGAARQFNGIEDKSLSVLLKHGYAPEEQYRSRGVQGAWTDVYGLCATIYKCITGVAPEDSLQRTYFDDTKLPSALAAEISPEIEEVLMRGMSVYQQDRYQSMKELKEAFKNASKSASEHESKTGQTDAADSQTENTGAISDGEMTRSLSSTAPKVVLEKPRYPKKVLVESGEEAVSAKRPSAKEKPQKPQKKGGGEKKRQAKGKPRKGWLKKVLASIAAVIVLAGIAFVVYNLAFFTTIGNERFPNNATSISIYNFSNTKIPREHLERLSRFSHLQGLALVGCMLTDEDVGVIAQETQHMRELKTLILSGNKEITNIDALAELTGLTHLEVNGASLSNLSAVASFESLGWLEASDNQIVDISALSGLKELMRLRFENNAISDISALAGLTELRTLYLSNNSISDISALARLEKLDDLYLSDNDISDISAFNDSTKLMYLDLAHNNISDISPIKDNLKMSGLYLNHNQIEDISALYNMRKIKRLDLSNNNISDVSVLSRLAEIDYLSIAKNQITDISSITGMSRLGVLDISNNRISDISPLRGMQPMEVALYGNEIMDISPMIEVLITPVVAIHNNKVSDVSALAQCKDLTSVVLFGNPITDLEQLTHIDSDTIILEYDETLDYSVLSDPSETEYYILNIPLENMYDLDVMLGDNVTLVDETQTQYYKEKYEAEQTDG